MGQVTGGLPAELGSRSGGVRSGPAVEGGTEITEVAPPPFHQGCCIERKKDWVAGAGSSGSLKGQVAASFPQEDTIIPTPEPS